MRCVDEKQDECCVACECWMMHGLERPWLFIGGFHGVRCYSKSRKRMGNTGTLVSSIPGVFKQFQTSVDVHAAMEVHCAPIAFAYFSIRGEMVILHF